MDLIIKNGTVVTSSSQFLADVGIKDGKIIVIGRNLPTENSEVVDATGKLVLPGAIDIHTHMSSPFGGTVSSDDYLSGTKAAACGGVTTLFDFARQQSGHGILEATQAKKACYEENACIDYALHCIITNLNEGKLLDEFEAAAKAGITSFKVYLVYKNEGLMVDDETFVKILIKAKEVGGITCVHAENPGLIDYNIDRFLKEGKTSPWYHYLSRPEYVEAEADYRAVHIAKAFDAPLYIVHMANQEGLKIAIDAKSEGYDIHIETCPHYLEFNSDVYKRADGIKFVCSPSIKGEESRLALLAAVKNGTIDTIATDHCPFTLEEKKWGESDFTKIPNGCGGIECRYPYMLSLANRGELSYSRAVELCAENPARIFGCEEKGVIEIGKDADIVIYDPDLMVTLKNELLHSECDHTIWEGIKVKGYPIATYLRGKKIYENGNYIGNPGEGKFIKRSRRKIKGSL